MWKIIDKLDKESKMNMGNDPKSEVRMVIYYFHIDTPNSLKNISLREATKYYGELTFNIEYLDSNAELETILQLGTKENILKLIELYETPLKTITQNNPIINDLYNNKNISFLDLFDIIRNHLKDNPKQNSTFSYQELEEIKRLLI